MIHCLTERPWNKLRWLVLAPHADDETLGAGALISQTAAGGRLAAVVYLTDGSGSHGPVDGRTGHLIATRRREAANALFRLTGNRALGPIHLGWKDAAPANCESRAFIRTTSMMTALCRRLQVDAIAVTAANEPHCDHAAAAQLAYAIRAQAKRSLLVAEYCVWADGPGDGADRALRTAPMLPGHRRHALRAHRSQLTAAYGPGFRLPPQRQRMPSSDILFLRRLP
ncbi:PIG-L deacetylase family protein [Novosphingobium sp. Rr 2-17]|uniref:PIG-L deacetylase family protein n=1 Tax=Novosphingobium sp. Rr 2-17 TaxID=555793 RepID=UPI001ED93793|nr:PIG-L family deacetylase [Novosphingobium sp. Rr 2-17]